MSSSKISHTFKLLCHNYIVYRREKETRLMETSGKVNDVEESLKKLGGMKGAVGGFVMTLEGEIIKSTLDPSTSSQVSELMRSLVTEARLKLSRLEQGNELEMLRLRTNKYQFVVVPDVSWLLVMVLNP